MKKPYHDLEKGLGYRFKRQQHLETALIHRSFRYENDEINRDNQRLEFLGDAVLGLVAADYLFRLFPEMQEGRLTHLRSSITNSDTLARIAGRLDLGKFLLIGKGELLSGGSERPSNLADCMEAVLGAAYLDGGVRCIRRIFNKLFVDELSAILEDVSACNPKGFLQELAQQKWKKSPKYKIVEEKGPAHDKTFVSAVTVDGQTLGEGSGSNKQAAEIAAAKDAIAHLQKDEPLDTSRVQIAED